MVPTHKEGSLEGGYQNSRHFILVNVSVCDLKIPLSFPLGQSCVVEVGVGRGGGRRRVGRGGGGGGYMERTWILAPVA